MQIHNLDEFHRRLLDSTAEGIVHVEGEGMDDQEILNSAGTQWFAWMGPGGVAQASLTIPGKINLISISTTYTLPRHLDLAQDPAYQFSGGRARLVRTAGLTFTAELFRGEAVELGEAVERLKREYPYGERIPGFMLLQGERGDLRMIHHLEDTPMPEIAPAGRVERQDGKLLYYPNGSGKSIDYSLSLFED